MRLRRVVTVGCATIAVLAVAAALALVHVSRQASESASYLVDSVNSVDVAQRLHMQLLQLADDVGSPEEARRYVALEESLNDARRYTQSPEEAQVVARVAKAVADARAELRSGTGRQSLHAADVVLSELVAINLQQAHRAEARAARLSQNAATSAVVGAIALIAMAVLLLFWARARLLQPLAELRERMGRAASGEAGVRAQERSAAELQEVARTFNAMASLLEQQKRDRLELLGRTAAQLEEPLARLRSATGALASQQHSPDSALQTSITAAREMERLSRMLGEWLDAARLEEGTLLLQRELVDCGELLGEAVALIRSLSAPHRFELQVPASPLMVVADGARLSQLLHNLLAQALREAPSGGLLRIGGDRDGGRARIWLRLAGAAAQGEPLFAALRKLDDALLGVPGAGLPTAVSRKLALANGGEIVVQRPAPGMVTLELWLPLATGAQPPAEKPQLLFS